MYRWGKTIFEVLQTCANKWPDRWLIQRDISVVLLRTVISTTQTLASQADKAILKIKNTIKTCGGIPITLALDLFDKIVLPILIYGAEICKIVKCCSYW